MKIHPAFRPFPQSGCGVALATAIFLTACGGGGSDDTAQQAGNPPAATALTISGTAATGAAIAGKTVDAKCASGAASGTSGADGAYTVNVASGSFPCLLRVTADSGAVLHGVAQGSGSTATADITPVSQLVVARVAGGDPAAYYAGFDSTAAAALTPAAVQAATSAVVQQLKNSGVDLSGVGDVLTAALTPATATSAGNAYGQQLVELDASLADSGTTLTQLTTTVAASSTAASAPSGTASLPADVLLRAKASNCAALRSGTYRAIQPTKGADIGDQFGTATLDAAALTSIDNVAGATATTLTPNGPCQYQTDAGTGTVVVSQAGLIVSRFLENGTPRLLVAFPEQTIAVAELAGIWNFLGFEINGAGTAYAADAGTATIGSDGVVSAVSFCADVKNCSPVTVTISFKANATGGFDFVDTTDNSTERYFAYRAGGGELMLVGVAGDGSFSVWTRKRTITLPAVGSGATGWNLALDNQNLASPVVGDTTNAVDTVDAANGTYTRTQQTVGANDAHSESVAINNPRDGYVFRPAATALAADGSTAVVREYTQLGLRGMGASVLNLPFLGWYLFSVVQP